MNKRQQKTLTGQKKHSTTEEKESESLERVTVKPIEETPRPKRPDTATSSHREYFRYSQINKHPGRADPEEGGKDREEATPENVPGKLTQLELAELSNIQSTLHDSADQTTIEVPDGREAGHFPTGQRTAATGFNIISWKPQKSLLEGKAVPDTPTRKVVPRKSIAYPSHLKSNSRLSNSSLSSQFNPSVEVIRAALATYEKTISEQSQSLRGKDETRPDA